MEIIIIVLLIGYALIKDILFYKEREKLQMKLMSRDLREYTSVTEEEAEDGESEEETIIPIEEATIDQILKSEDRV